jgi:selenide,water dikinase
VLADNLTALSTGRRLRRYQPQRDFLTLLDLGDGTAIGLRNNLAWRGRGTRRLKERIDRAFMEKFQVLDERGGEDTAFVRELPAMDDRDMVCGGCAAKVGQGPLSRALARVGSRPDPDVTLGLAEPDDVAVLQRPSEQLVTSIDAFPAFLDDPWMVGRVAAENAMSDLFAKGVAPRIALAIVTVPGDEDPEEVLVQVLGGARDALDTAAVTLAGGHTTVGERLSVGFAVTGFAPNTQPVLRKGGLVPGDVLVLTRPLGTGVLFHADMAGRAAGSWIEHALAGLLQGNRAAAAVALEHGAHASTDVTGFGLGGHAGEMAVASQCRVRISLSDLPALAGAIPLLQRGERSTFHAQNREGLRGMSVGALPSEAASALELIFDPQTLGGLLIGIPEEKAGDLLAALKASGHPDAAIIGRAEHTRGEPSPVRLEWKLPPR